MGDSSTTQEGDSVPTDHVIPNNYPQRTGAATGEFGAICDNCDERMYRYSINDGGHYRRFDRCPNCGEEYDTEE